MKFGNKLEKQDLIDAGLDPDKLALFQEKGVTKDDLAAMSTALETKLTTTLTDQIKNSFTELETKLRTPQKKEGGNEGGGGNNEQPDEYTEYLTDPVGFVKKQTNGVVVAAAVEFKRQSRDMAWREASRTMRGFKNAALLEEIEKEWAKYPPEKMAQFQTDPERCIKEIHDLVLGRHHDEIVQDTNKKDGKYNLVHSGAGSITGNSTMSHSSGSGSGKAELSEEEKLMARKFGMTDDEWIKQGEDMEKEEVERKKGTLVGGSK